MARAQRKLAHQEKGSKNYDKQKKRIALLHLKVARCHQDFHYSIAHWLCQTYDLISFENLNIRGLARTPLAKSILDCAWSAFLQILQVVAVKRGKQTVEVEARGSSTVGVVTPISRLNSCPPDSSDSALGSGAESRETVVSG